jgi:hypothetical protein
MCCRIFKEMGPLPELLKAVDPTLTLTPEQCQNGVDSPIFSLMASTGGARFVRENHIDRCGE